MTLPSALFSCCLLGLQHGVDWDHVAAISDVTGVQTSPREATRCGLLYALGHAAMVGLLGISAIALKHALPASFSSWMQRIVGLTLVVLGGYVFVALAIRGIPVSRGQALGAIAGRLFRRARPKLSSRQYGRKSSLGLGVLHGIGAETPTQLSVLLIAANLGGLGNGILGLTAFAGGMVVSNLILTAVSTGLFAISRGQPVWLKWVGAVTAGYSIWIGFTFVAP